MRWRSRESRFSLREGSCGLRNLCNADKTLVNRCVSVFHQAAAERILDILYDRLPWMKF